MSWSQDAKQAMFGSDSDFRDCYCTETTMDRLADVDIAVRRGVLWRLADAIPLAAHSTPRLWTPKGEPPPIVVIGRLNAGGNILEPKVGLCGKDHLYLFSRVDNVDAFSTHAKLPRFRDLWVPWRTAGNGHDYRRSKACLDCSPSIDLPEGHPLSYEHPMWRFLLWIRDQQTSAQWRSAHDVGPLLAARRQAIKEGCDCCDCICPQLVEEMRARLPRRGNGIGNAV